MMKLLGILTCVIILALNVRGEDVSFRACSPGRKDGDVNYTVHSDGTCELCNCDEDKEFCSGCKDQVDEGFHQLDCIQQEKKYNHSEDFPKCCKGVVYVCPGEDDYPTVPTLN